MILDEHLLCHGEQTPGISGSLTKAFPLLSQTSHERGGVGVKRPSDKKKQAVHILCVSRKH